MVIYKMGVRYRKFAFVIPLVIFTIIFVTISHKSNDFYQNDLNNNQETIILKFDGNNNDPMIIERNWRGLSDEETGNLSKLGRILYLDEEVPKLTYNNATRTYQILIWKYGKAIENRHLKQYGNRYTDPFADCSVHNCKITYEDSAVETADIVVFHLHRLSQKDKLPTIRKPQQRWTFLTDESPYHTFLSQKNGDLSKYNGIFNWSMTYRMDSDIPVPYGRAIPRKTPLKTDELIFNKRRDVLIAILGSNCGGNNKRWEYVRELQKYIKVDVYGGCGTLKTCPGHFRSNCHDIDQYLFYLSFENSNCDEYLTEKLWWNAYEKNSIPIIMGGASDNYKQLLPPSSYLLVDDFAHPRDLATYINYLNETNRFFLYYKWKTNYQILNEHGYFQSKSYHYCRICEALNYNSNKTRIYQDLNGFWSAKKDCRPGWST